MSQFRYLVANMVVNDMALAACKLANSYSVKFSMFTRPSKPKPVAQIMRWIPLKISCTEILHQLKPPESRIQNLKLVT